MFGGIEKQPDGRLYPLRPFENTSQPLKELDKLEKGTIKPLLESIEEFDELLKYEENWFEKIKEIYDIKIDSYSFYPEYFLTESGQKNLKDIFGIKNSKKFKGIEDAILWLYKNSAKLSGKRLEERKVKQTTRKKSIKYIADTIEEFLLENIDEETGEVNIKGKELPANFIRYKKNSRAESIGDLAHPERVAILVNDKDLLAKILKYRSLRKKIKKNIARLERMIGKSRIENTRTNMDRAKILVLNLYLKKINLAITHLYPHAIAIWQKEGFRGSKSLSKTEKKIVKIVGNFDNYEKNISRFDRFQYGAASEYNNGKREQISFNLQDYCDDIRKIYFDNEIKELKKKNIFEKKIEVADYQAMAIKLMENLGIKTSDEMSKIIDNDTPARDKLWRVAIDKTKKSMGVNPTGKCLVLDNRKKSLYQVFCVALAHEFTHIYQNINKANINLKIFAEIGGDRGTVFSEAGAKMMEDKMSNKLFGVSDLPHPHYVTAMLTRLKGGDYFECVESFYDSAKKVSEQKKQYRLSAGENPEVVQADFGEECKENLRTALSRIKRIFRPKVVSLNSKSGYLTNSKATAYLEQLIVVSELQQSNKAFYTFVGGLNLDNILALTKIGIINQDFINKVKSQKLDEKLIAEIKKIYLQNYHNL